MRSRVPYHFPEFTGQVPERLFWEVKRGGCVLFAGAGLSSQVLRSNGRPLPGWETLLGELAELAHHDGYPVTDDVVQTIHKGQLLEAGQELQQIIPNSSLESYLASIFADPSLRPSPSHLTLPDMRLRAVLTTNYDALIEDAYLEATGARPLAMTYGDYLSGHRDPILYNDFFVYKVHGDYRDTSTIALGTRSYQDLVHSNPGYRFLLESIFAAYTVLFIGFGGSDPDIRHVLDALAARFRDRPPQHYILLPRGRWTDTEKRRARDDRGLELIEYNDMDNHVQVGAFLQHLARGEPERDGRLRVTLIVNRTDEAAASRLWGALSSIQYRMTAVDLGRTSQAGWFDDLRAQVELCDVVILVANRNFGGQHDLIMSVAKCARRRIIIVLDATTPTHSLLFGDAVILSADDEGWVGIVLEQLGEIRTGINLGG